MKLYVTIFVLVVLAFAMTGRNSFAASFDCKQAKSETEKMICSNPRLNELDAEMGKLYKTLLEKQSKLQRNSLQDFQRGWIKEREDYCRRGDRIKCMLKLTEDRVTQLQNNDIQQGFLLISCDERDKKTGWDICHTSDGRFQFMKPPNFPWVKKVARFDDCRIKEIERACGSKSNLDLVMDFRILDHHIYDKHLDAPMSPSDTTRWSMLYINNSTICAYTLSDCGMGRCDAEFYYASISNKSCYVAYSSWTRGNCSTIHGDDKAGYKKCEDGKVSQDELIKTVVNSFKFTEPNQSNSSNAKSSLKFESQ